MAEIAIVSQRLLGHIIPALGVGYELSKRGHSVTVLTHKEHKTMIEESGMNFIEIGWDKFPDLFLFEMMDSLVEVFTNKSFDLVVCDSAQGPPSFIAELFKIPWVSFQTTVPLPDNLVPGKKKAHQRRRELYGLEINKVRKHYGLAPLTDSRRTRGDLAGLSPYLHLVMVLPEFIIDCDGLPPSSQVVGLCSFNKSIEDSLTKKNLSQKNILVCTSSLNRPDFREKTNHYVKSTIQAFGDSELNINITLEYTPRFNGDLPSNVNFITDHPVHHQLMPTSEVVITHGGCNTLLKSISYGCPMVIIPLGADHHILAQRCKELGVAIVINPEDVTPEVLKENVNQLLENQSYTERSKFLSNKMSTGKSASLSAVYIEKILEK
ncbi:glycosyltransferase [Cytobacillus pseudoceanisediminis]|uniref:glycosyltransferase n=1 Tax=Cytobacillus pseudoceanisediminis TaxID=3051614 RepID=UPI003C2E9B9C